MVTFPFVPTGTLYGNLVEVLPDQLYFGSFEDPPHSDSQVRYVNLDERVHYEPFYTDFGPLNLSVLYRFTYYIHGLLESQNQKSHTQRKRKLVVYTDADERNRVNGAYMLGAYLIIYHGVSADAAYLRIVAAQPPKFIGFRDAAMGEPTYLLHIHDVLRGVEKAMHHKWLDFATFDAEEYELYERVENGDFNWIIPDKILSFCGPHNESRVEDGYSYHSPETYFDYFREHNITTIVRLNMRMYEAKKFTDAGFDHVDLFFIDGSTPSDDIVMKFIDVVDRARGGVAVHCKAGLGRTGTLIACWMMKHFGLTAAECMAWLRICRPGSVIGPQQQFLVNKQKFCWAMSKNNVVHMPSKAKENGTLLGEKKVKKLTSRVDEIRLSHMPVGDQKQTSSSMGQTPKSIRPSILPLRQTRRSADQNGNSMSGGVVDETALDSAGRSQGDRLLAMKAKSQHQHAGAGHAAGSSSSTAPVSQSLTCTARTRSSSGGTKTNGNPLTTSKTSGSAAAQAMFPTHQAVFPIVSRVAGVSTSSPRFSSPTTPIKPQGSPSSMSPGGFRRPAVRSLMSNTTFVPPISRVIVAAEQKSKKTLTPSSKSTPALRKINSGIRARPYPSQGARVELAASGTYELRSRQSPPRITESAMQLPPNSDAILGRRKKRLI